ncbi:MAG: phage portal protein [Nocardioidaceae bacterium]|nr:phage portal protein [Dermatophilaceae bacterium]NUR05855.1 phage portal protein [Nocardioidaceae bacterium]NUR80027.1 phage portal protein [Dermatophilaceae bacterium]
MSLFFREQQRRTWTEPPPIPLNSERGAFIGRRGVNLSTTEASMQKVAVAASVNLLANIVAMLPLKTYSGGGGAPRQISTPKWMLDISGDGYGTSDWLKQVIYSGGLRGNVYGLAVERDPVTAKPRQLALQHPDDVDVRRDPEGRPEWYINGRKTDPSRIWHRRWYPVPGSIRGASPVARHALTIGLGLASERFGAEFFNDGGHPTALFQNTKSTIDGDQARTIKQRITAVLSGNREPLVLGADWDYKPLQVSPNESQFLESNNYTNAECARIFGPGMPEMLGYETGGSMTYANIEQRGLDLLTFTLDPWLVWVESMLSDLLPQPQYVKFERKALARTDLLTRFRAHEIALRNEWEVVNEVRALEEQQPVPWGDEPRASKSSPPIPVQMEN